LEISGCDTSPPLPPFSFSFFPFRHRPSLSPGPSPPAARFPPSLSSERQQAGPTCRGHPNLRPPPFFLHRPRRPPAVPPPRLPAPVRLLHYAIKAPPHFPAASTLPLHRNRRAPSRPPPPLMAGRSSSHATASAPCPFPPPTYKKAAPPPAPPAPLPLPSSHAQHRRPEGTRRSSAPRCRSAPPAPLPPFRAPR
jgi:hypothetical protein